jgi:pilus assembly protein Flp/PilA
VTPRILRYDDRGATAVEYALIAALIAAVIIAGVTLLGLNVKSQFDDSATQIANAAGPVAPGPSTGVASS